MTTAGLGRSKNGTVRPFDQSALERQAPMLEVDVLPPQSQELAATSARRLFSLVHLGDYVSLYLALCRGVEPTPVAIIDQFKSVLAKA
jgi:Bacterial phospho-glucose isomerase C-terminal SIS domain